MKYYSTNLLLSAFVPKNRAINDDNSNRMQRKLFPPVYLYRPRDISLHRLVFESERPIKATNGYWTIQCSR